MPIFIPAAIAVLGAEVAVAYVELTAALLVIATRFYPVIYEVQLMLSETALPAQAQRAAATLALKQTANPANLATARAAVSEMDRRLSGVEPGLQHKIRQAVIELLEKMTGRPSSAMEEYVRELQIHTEQMRRKAAQGSASGGQSILRLPPGYCKDQWIKSGTKFWRQADSGVPIEAVKPLGEQTLRRVNETASQLKKAQETINRVDPQLTEKLRKKGVEVYLEVDAEGAVYQVMAAPGTTAVRHKIVGVMGSMQYSTWAKGMMARL